MMSRRIDKLLRAASASALLALALMVLGTLWLNPYLIVVVMTVGQALGLLSFALYLYAIATDLRRSGASSSSGRAT